MGGTWPVATAASYQSCQDNVKTCTTDLEERRRRLNICTGEQADCEGTLTAESRRLVECNANLGDQQRQLTTCTGQRTDCQDSLTTCNQSLESFRTQIRSCNASLLTSDLKLGLCTKNLDEYNANVSELSVTGLNLKRLSDECTENLQSERDAKKKCTSDLDICQQEGEESAKGLIAAQVQIQALTNDLAVCRTRRDELETQLQSARAVIAVELSWDLTSVIKDSSGNLVSWPSVQDSTRVLSPSGASMPVGPDGVRTKFGKLSLSNLCVNPIRSFMFVFTIVSDQGGGNPTVFWFNQAAMALRNGCVSLYTSASNGNDSPGAYSETSRKRQIAGFESHSVQGAGFPHKNTLAVHPTFAVARRVRRIPTG